MIFTPALRGASLLRRYKRFLADAAAAGVEIIAYAARVKPTGLSLYRKLRIGGI